MYSDDAVFCECRVRYVGALATTTTEWCRNEVAEQFGVDLGTSVISTQVVGDWYTDFGWQVL